MIFSDLLLHGIVDLPEEVSGVVSIHRRNVTTNVRKIILLEVFDFHRQVSRSFWLDWFGLMFLR